MLDWLYHIHLLTIPGRTNDTFPQIFILNAFSHVRPHRIGCVILPSSLQRCLVYTLTVCHFFQRLYQYQLPFTCEVVCSSSDVVDWSESEFTVLGGSEKSQ